MGELMDDGAHAIRVGVAIVFPAVNLARAGITSQIDAVVGLVSVVIHIGLVGPQVAAVVAAEVGGVSCHDKINHVHHAVTIAVIVAEVNCRVQLIDGREENAAHLSAVGGGAGIVHRHGASDVELRRELPHAVVIVIVPGASRTGDETAIGAVKTRIVFLIHHGVEVVGAIVEGPVVVVDEYQQTAEVIVVATGGGILPVALGMQSLALGGLRLVNQPLLELGDHFQLAGVAHHRVVGHHVAGHQPGARLNGIHIVAVAALQQGVAIGRHRAVVELVTHQAHGQAAAVALSDIHGLRVGRDSRNCHHAGNNKQKCQQELLEFDFHHVFLVFESARCYQDKVNHGFGVQVGSVNNKWVQKMRILLGNDIVVGQKPCGANANYTNLSNFIRKDIYYFVKLVSLAKFALKNFQGQQLYHCLL